LEVRFMAPAPGSLHRAKQRVGTMRYILQVIPPGALSCDYSY
jgi:hypothetical protein